MGHPIDRRNRLWISAGTILAALLLTGCWTPPRATPVEMQRGLVWLFPGVEGGPWSLKDAVRAFRDTGEKRAIRVMDWKRIGGTLANLTDEPGNRKRAAAIAAEIAIYAADYPDRPIDLVGYSGGGGMAIFVAEALSDDVRLERVILCQPALSPDYDLSTALARVNDRIVHFYAPGDWLILGAGTTTFGTMDRKLVASAGMVGFDPNTAVTDAAERGRLIQIPWKIGDQTLVHYGGHLPILTYSWNRTAVAPQLSGGSAPDD